MLLPSSRWNLDRIVVALSGSAAERVVLKDFTDGGESDNDSAVQLAMHLVKAGFAGPGVFVVDVVD